MKKEDIHLGDWQRILLGEAPLEFLLEAALRTLVVYVVLVLRLLGKRMNAQLTVTELAVMIMLGGIVSVPMEVLDRGILQGVLVLTCVLLLYWGFNYLSFHFPRAERLKEGTLHILVTDGVLNLKALAITKVSRAQLFAHLRSADIQHLSQVQRAYLEANGQFSIYQQEPPRPGLSVLPEKDKVLRQAAPTDAALSACQHCGHTEPAAHQLRPCPNCGQRQWATAVTQL